jgi:hypothetical protein
MSEAKEKRIPDYERALEEARNNLPISMDRMTGEERVLFGVDKKEEPKKVTKETKIKMMATVIVPDWLQTALGTAKLDTVDLGDLETICKLMTAVCAQNKLHGVTITLNPKNNECTFFTTSTKEPKLSVEEKTKLMKDTEAVVKALFATEVPPTEKKAAKKATKSSSKINSSKKRTKQ